MKFFELTQYFEKIEKTASRLEITRILSELFKKLTIDEISQTMYLLQGRVVPLYEKLEFQMAEKMVIKAVLLGLSLDKKLFINRYKQIGDLGKTVEEFKQNYPSLEKKDFTINEVFNCLFKLAQAAGSGSQEQKISILSDLIRRIDPLSCRYLVRIPLGVMRLGFSDMTILDGLSWMSCGDKSLRPKIEKAYHVRPDLGFIAKTLKQTGPHHLSDVKPKLFTPIIMMRAERLSSGKDIIDKIGRCVIEPKYDGFRLQVHFKKSKVKGKTSSDGEIRLYSRNLEEVSYMYPDIVDGVKNEVNAKEVIFEGEAIGFDPIAKNFLPFQETVQRKRKHGVAEKVKEIPLKLFVFELLYLNGKSYLDSPFIKRRKALETIVGHKTNNLKQTIIIAPEVITDEEKKLEVEFNNAVNNGLEGIIAKKIDGIYQPGARGWNWIKLKSSYTSKIEDTIDCLVMGYDLGQGKRTGFGIGAFLVGVFDEKQDKFVTVAKIGTGLTDQEWKQLKVKSQKLKVNSMPSSYLVDKQMECDVWLTPKIVVEIRADIITRSSVHTAGRVMQPSKSGQALTVKIPGYGLRFPRLERFREDKSPSDITSLSELVKLFNRQAK